MIMFLNTAACCARFLNLSTKMLHVVKRCASPLPCHKNMETLVLYTEIDNYWVRVEEGDDKTMAEYRQSLSIKTGN